ncbi:hypothetical protein CFIMG_004517RA [Ceratocystis fimbriata CBS 114723]|uniref:Hyaluronan/mRNA-binding protein domain-containing protein n=1 Tax=Ceratocystis fimbriata CBS 114723 TaxID=1035309 RepID=A0A2C5WW43_9PEZI|nr:hypothetical protein CFIMG_004517RA [Ceratocystis fimbriata CBS 114723]
MMYLTRTHRDNHEQASGAVRMPKYYGKAGYTSTDPKNTKKNGNGKANWGAIGDDLLDDEFNFTHTRRRSNSSSFSNTVRSFKTKFDVNEPEPVFEEELHGPLAEDETNPLSKSTDAEESASTASSEL